MTTGAELSRRFFAEAVQPALADRFPELQYAAALLGTGSDVLGYDDGLSTDHDWGPQLTVLTDSAHVASLDAYVDEVLPETFGGHPVRFPITFDPETRHRVGVTTLDAFLSATLGVDPRRGLDVDDWLSLTGQAVLEVIAGEVYADGPGELTAVRRALAWYPDDVWTWLVLADWTRIAEELHLMSRAGQAGDSLGARVLIGRLVGVAMHLGFLLERRWPPYPKWFGTAFGRLPRAATAAPALEATLATDDWQERQQHFATALRVLHDVQGEVGLPTVSEPVVAFYDRPYLGIAPELTAALTSALAGSPLADRQPVTGSVEQWVDGVGVLVRPGVRRAVVERAVEP